MDVAAQVEIRVGGKLVRVRCVPPEELPPAAQAVCRAFHEAFAHMARGAGVRGEDLVVMLRGGSAARFLGPTVEACLPAGARVFVCAHNKVAHTALHRERTEQAFHEACRAFNPHAGAAFLDIWARLSAQAALPAAQGAAQQAGQGMRFAGSWGALLELRMVKLLEAQRPDLYRVWVGMGAAQPHIRDFLEKHAPDVLNEAGKQQAAHLNTPEAITSRAERHSERLLEAQRPDLYRVWVGMGAAQPHIRDFLEKHAPDVLKEAGKQQAAHLNAPEAIASRAERHSERMRQRLAQHNAAMPEGVPPQYKECSNWAKGTCSAPYKRIEDFNRDARHSDGLRSSCADCDKWVWPRAVHVRELLQVPRVQV